MYRFKLVLAILFFGIDRDLELILSPFDKSSPRRAVRRFVNELR